MKPFMQEFIVGFILVMVLVIFTIGGLSNMHDAQELVAGLILLATLIVFTLGKSPVFRVDRAGMSIIGASLMTAFGILSLEENYCGIIFIDGSCEQFKISRIFYIYRQSSIHSYSYRKNFIISSNFYVRNFIFYCN